MKSFCLLFEDILNDPDFSVYKPSPTPFLVERTGASPFKDKQRLIAELGWKPEFRLILRTFPSKPYSHSHCWLFFKSLLQFEVAFFIDFSILALIKTDK
jgi:hypothetical protein